ncbi:hypothetical protein SCAB_40911 [Streptomyces scabiei 87.22]|uniref:Uncharacterized protein n=1 Tax=Streptomyces scabiei (strain 87.22) TaxID=680198 RepID=C9Z2F0_STRSW|nr:hypothetical protein SCAB_40911 [Streptomyces scabiei 87.22]
MWVCPRERTALARWRGAEGTCRDEPVVVQRPEPEHEAPAVEVSGHGVEM